MKKILLILSLVVGLMASTKGNLTNKQEDALQAMVIMYGYRCDSVSYASISSWDSSIRLTCNNNRYVYNIEDKGGRWIVEVK